MHCSYIALCVIILSMVLGCGHGGLERVDVSGEVTFGGQPVRDGQIRFLPKPGTNAPVTIEPITEGRYSTATSSGVPVGSYRVEIRAYDPSVPAPSGPGMPPRRQLLPTKYNTQSTLEMVVESGQGPLNQDFELTP